MVLSSLLLSVGLLTACTTNTTKNQSTKSSQSQQTSSSTSKEDKKTSTKDASSSKDSKETSSAIVDSEEKQVVGSDDYGYIEIPKNWVKFQDLAGGDSIQYADGSPINIVTLNAFTREKAQVPEGQAFNAQELAGRIAYSYTQPSEKEKINDISADYVQVAGVEGAQIHLEFKTGIVMNLVLFQTEENGKVYFLTLEGTKDKVNTLMPGILSSWKPQK